MRHLHKRFTDEQIKVMFQEYDAGKMRIAEVQKMLEIGKTRFFALLKKYKQDPENFSVAYERASTAIEGVYHEMPILRDPDGYIYIKQEGDGLLMGGCERTAKPWGMKGIPETFEFTELPEDWDQFELFMENAIQRCPIMENAEIRYFTVVPESFTPDNKYMLGEAPGVKNFFVAAGMNSAGIANAAGAGKAISEWTVEGHPTDDLWEVDIRRCHGWQNNSRYLQDRITATVGLQYADHWPYKQPKTARPVRCSPLHYQLKEQGACFGVNAG